MTYLDFLRTKIEVAPVSGFEVEDSEIHNAYDGSERERRVHDEL